MRCVEQMGTKSIVIAAFCCHFLFLIPFALVENSLKDDFVRWNIDWILYFLTIISSIVYILKNKEKDFASIFFKYYFILYTFFAVFIGLGLLIIGYSPKVAESDRYTVHKHPTHGVDPGVFVLYKKDGLLEKKLSFLIDDGFCYDMINFKEEGGNTVSFDLKCICEAELCDRDSTCHFIKHVK